MIIINPENVIALGRDRTDVITQHYNAKKVREAIETVDAARDMAGQGIVPGPTQVMPQDINMAPVVSASNIFDAGPSAQGEIIPGATQIVPENTSMNQINEPIISGVPQETTHIVDATTPSDPLIANTPVVGTEVQSIGNMNVLEVTPPPAVPTAELIGEPLGQADQVADIPQVSASENLMIDPGPAPEAVSEVNELQLLDGLEAIHTEMGTLHQQHATIISELRAKVNASVREQAQNATIPGPTQVNPQDINMAPVAPGDVIPFRPPAEAITTNENEQTLGLKAA